MFVSNQNLAFFGRNMDWANPYIASYVELQKNISPESLEKPIADILTKNASQYKGHVSPYIINLTDYYRKSNNRLVQKMLFSLSAIALFILLMAIFNFINMSISQSTTRLREIGVRKVMGSLKQQLIFQFLAESILIVFISSFFGLLIFVFAQNIFSEIIGRQIPDLSSFPFYFIGFILLFIAVLGLFTGIYPAFVLSSQKPISSLKGKLSNNENILLRKSLVAFQFGLASIAFVGVIVISQQIDLFLSNNIGYNKDFVVTAPVSRDWSPTGVRKMIAIRNQFARMSKIKAVSLSFEIPNGNNGSSQGIYKSGSDSTNTVAAQVLSTDENFLSTYQIPLKAGTFFKGNGLDSGQVILNETAVMALGINKEKAIGIQIRVAGDPTLFTIKGVTKDFHLGSMQQKIPPIMLFNVHANPIYRYLSFRLTGVNLSNELASLQEKWTKILPQTAFDYTFMDDTLAKLYKSEMQLKKASILASILALIIVLLGVIGLVSLSIQKRTKEIGIRKILGSSVTSIINLFLKEFLIVIVFSNLLAIPIAYLLIQKWLQEYAYRINISGIPFIISFLVLGIITTLIIGLQTYNAALANPVKSLKTE